MNKTESRTIFVLSFMPIIVSIIMIAGFVYASRADIRDEYYMFAWSGFLGDATTLYVAVVFVFLGINAFYLATAGRRRYDPSINALFNLTGFMIMCMIIVTWYVA